jgi:hypothetical protein
MIYDKNDVFKYWLVKKIGKKQSDSGIFTKFINPLLASFQLSIPTPLSEIYSMPNIKIIGWGYQSCFAYQERLDTKNLNVSLFNNNTIRPRFVSHLPEFTYYDRAENLHYSQEMFSPDRAHIYRSSYDDDESERRLIEAINCLVREKEFYENNKKR